MVLKNQPIELKISGDKGLHQFTLEVESDEDVTLGVKGSCGCIVINQGQKFDFKKGINFINATFNRSYCATDCLKTISIGPASYQVKIKR